MIPRSPDVVPPTAAAVLAAVLDQPRPTVRSVALAVNRSVRVTYDWLRWLDERDLVRFPPNRAGALRPAVAFVPIRPR